MRRQVRLVAGLGAAALVASCGKSAPPDEGSAAAKRPGTAETVAAGPPLATAAWFRLDAVAPATCVAGTPCEARLVLTATGGYHVNKDYPFKFIPDAASPVAAEPGTFAVQGQHQGTMTLTLRPTAPGTAEVRGTFKLSVCDDDTCKIEEPTVAFSTTVQSPAG